MLIHSSRRIMAVRYSQVMLTLPIPGFLPSELLNIPYGKCFACYSLCLRCPSNYTLFLFWAENFNQAYDRFILPTFRCWRPSLVPDSHYCSVVANSQTHLRLVSSVIGRWTLWSAAKADKSKFCPFNSLLICNPVDDRKREMGFSLPGIQTISLNPATPVPWLVFNQISFSTS